MVEVDPGELKRLNWWLDQGYKLDDLVQVFEDYDWYLHKSQVENFMDFLASLDNYGTTRD